MDLPNILFSIFGGIGNTFRSVDWMFVYVFSKYTLLALDIVLLIAIIILLEVDLSYRIKVD